MGKRGPQPTPAAVLQMRGSPLARQRLRGEPRPDPTRPTCPSWITDEAKRLWRELVPDLAKMGCLGRCDRTMLTLLVQTWADWREAEEFLAKHGTTYPVIRDGQPPEFRQYPHVRMARQLSEQVLRFGREFGLTPAARAGLGKVATPPAQEPVGKARFFGKSS